MTMDRLNRVISTCVAKQFWYLLIDELRIYIGFGWICIGTLVSHSYILLPWAAGILIYVVK